MFRFPRLVLCTVALCGLIASGCTRGGPSSSPPAPTEGGQQNPTTVSTGLWSDNESSANYARQYGTVVSQVTYQPNAVVFDVKTTESALKGMSQDGVTYVLDAASPAAKLKPGSVLFLYGIAIRKVASVRTEGSNVVVTTSDADITDLIKDGHIHWRVPLDFSIVAAQPQPAMPTSWLENLIASPAEAGESESPYSFEGTLGPVDYEMAFSPDIPARRLNFDVKYQFSKWGGLWRLQGEGYIEHIAAEGDFNISNGLINSMMTEIDGIEGHVDFEWMAQQNVPSPISLIDQSFKVKVPYANVEYPLIIEGIPLILEVSAAVLVHPAWTGAHQVTRGKFTVDYSGNLGFSYSDGAAEPEGSLASESESIDPETSIVAPNAMGFVAALEAPRIELALASLLPSSLAKFDESLSAENAMVQALGGKYVSRKAKTARMMQLIEDIASPVKPYGYVDVVTATGTFTNGMITSSLVALPPCQRDQLTMTANAGVGIKLNFLHHMPIAIVKKILKPFGHSVTIEAFEAAKPIYGPKTIYRWAEGIKCPGDSSQ
jgi:hypothetical protein